MWPWRRLLLVPAVLVMLAPGPGGIHAGDVFTSSAKIQAMLATEPVQLEGLRAFLRYTEKKAERRDSDILSSEDESSEEDPEDAEDDEKSEYNGDDEEDPFKDIVDIKRFYATAEERVERFWNNESAIRTFVRHPTNAFFAIRHAHSWFQLRHNATEEFKTDLLQFLPNVFTPGPSDLLGAATAIIRLQRTYRLSPADVIRGDVAGRQGIPLTPRDALLVARAASMGDNLPEAEEWLRLLLTIDGLADNIKAAALGHLGLISLTFGREEEAEAFLEEALVYGKMEDSVYELKMRLRSGLPPIRDETNFARDHESSKSRYSRLCARNTTVGRLLPHHLCRWRCSQLPWLRYKEEVLSRRPYASIFHDVIASWEAEEVKRLAFQSGLDRGTVINSDASKHYSDVRTSDAVFLKDDVSLVIRRLSKRVEMITGLDTTQRWPHNFDSSEGFQVVNYGIGGHYSQHHDPIILQESKPTELTESGDRLATFLIYLEDVEIGGKTVFVDADISVPSVKGTALFWYNFDPEGELDTLTLHGGCPVVLGEKWVTNKWIWDYGNTFRRPCPLRRGDSQWELDKQFHATCP